MQLETMTLFHDVPYCTTGRAWIDDVATDDKGNVYVVLSETLFYPQGGGQKGDRGVLRLDADRSIPVTDTKKADGVIRHYVSGDEAAVNALRSSVGEAEIEIELNWQFRYHQMRIHSAAHLIHCFLERETAKSIDDPVRSPLYEDHGENQYDFVGEFTADDLQRATGLLNGYTSESHEIKTCADEAHGPGFRWWLCDEWKIPCGGVHPQNVNEIGRIQTSMRERKGKTTVSFALAVR